MIKVFRNLEKKRMINKKPHPYLVFLIAWAYFLIWYLTFTLSLYNPSVFLKFMTIVMVFLSLFSIIFAIIHIIIVIVLR